MRLCSSRASSGLGCSAYTQCFWPSVSSSTQEPPPTLRPHRWRPRRVSLPLLPPHLLQLSSKHRLLRLSPSAPSPAAASTSASRPRSAAALFRLAGRLPISYRPNMFPMSVYFSFYLCSWLVFWVIFFETCWYTISENWNKKLLFFLVIFGLFFWCHRLIVRISYYT